MPKLITYSGSGLCLAVELRSEWELTVHGTGKAIQKKEAPQCLYSQIKLRELMSNETRAEEVLNQSLDFKLRVT